MTKHDAKVSSKWPTLEALLVESKVIHGVALEKMVRENQDSHILRREEARDKLWLPVWLMVYWRKHHPDDMYSGPSGGYQLVLTRLDEWMFEHQDLTSEQGQMTDRGLTASPTIHSGKKGAQSGN